MLTVEQLKQAMASHRHNPKGTLKDLRLLLHCSVEGNFEPMFSTRLYQNHGAEYCEYLSIISYVQG